MVALLWLRYWLCMLLSGVYGSLFSTRAELRDALLQWHNADEATKLQLTSLASCRTFSCPAGTTWTATRRPNASAVRATVTAASCCRCAAPNEVPIRSKEPDLECQSCAAGKAPKDDRCEACASGETRW
eukprot:g11775.t1